jgi:hypothetical protein
LIDNTLYNDNAYISDIYNTVESTEDQQAWSQEESCVAKDVFQEAAPVHEPSSALYDALNAFTHKLPESGSAPPAEQDLISVRYVFEDDGAPVEPVEPPTADEPLGCAVGLDVPGVGTVFLVDSADEAERLNLPPGRWLTRADMELLAPLSEAERRAVMVYMVNLGGRLRPS